jgi:hypothetical protein
MTPPPPPQLMMTTIKTMTTVAIPVSTIITRVKTPRDMKGKISTSNHVISIRHYTIEQEWKNVISHYTILLMTYIKGVIPDNLLT